MALKISQYTHIIENYPNDKDLIYNTLTKSLLILPHNYLQSIQSSEGLIKINNDKTEKLLRESNILIDEKIDEINLFKYWYYSEKYTSKSLNYTIMPTYDCNCKCVYCYEDGIKKKGFMSSKTTSDIINWIIKQIENIKPLSISISFHGGEPFLDIDTVYKIGTSLKKYTNNKGLTSDFTIVTNGTILSNEIIDKLINIPISTIMFTIDGPENIHNIRRPYLSGKGTYKNILKNIKMILGKGIITVCGPNIDLQNYEEIPKLFDIFINEGFSNRNDFLIYIGTMTRGITTNSPKHFKKYVNLIKPKKKAEMLISLYNIAIEKGLSTIDIIDSFGFCSFKKANHYIIDPQGNLYRCTSDVGREDNFVGSIYDNIKTVTKYSADLVGIAMWEKENKCKKCKYLPLCLGGCSHEALLKCGSRKHINCQEILLDEMLTEMIKFSYRQKKIKKKRE